MLVVWLEKFLEEMIMLTLSRSHFLAWEVYIIQDCD